MNKKYRIELIKKLEKEKKHKTNSQIERLFDDSIEFKNFEKWIAHSTCMINDKKELLMYYWDISNFLRGLPNLD